MNQNEMIVRVAALIGITVIICVVIIAVALS